MRLRDKWQFIIGQLVEKIVATDYKRDGWGIVATCDINNGGAPVLTFETERVTLPDLLAIRRGHQMWIEVKAYDAPAHNKRFDCYVHGVPVRLVEQYARHERETGSEVYLVILEIATGELLVSDRPLSQLKRMPCLCRGGCRSEDAKKHIPSGRGIREMQWYFDRADFELRCKLDDKTLTDLRDKRDRLRGHALPRHGEKREKRQPGAFDIYNEPCRLCGNKTPDMFSVGKLDNVNDRFRMCSDCWRSGRQVA